MPLLSVQPFPTTTKKTLFSKFSGTTTAPTPGLQTTQQAFDKIIRDVAAQAQQDPELQEATHMNALFDAKKIVASKKKPQFYVSCLRVLRRQEDAQEPEEDGEAVSKDIYDLEYKKNQQGPHGPQGLRLRKNTTVISLLKRISALKQLLYKIVTLK